MIAEIEVIKRSDPSVKQDDIKVFDGGWDHLVILANGLAYRFPRNKDVEIRLEREINFLKEFKTSSSIQIPLYELKLDTVTKKKFVTHKFIKGSPLTVDLISKFNPENTLKIGRQLGIFLKDIHSSPIERAEVLGLPHQEELESTRTYFSSKLKKLETIVFPLLTDTEVQWSRKIFDEFDKNIRKAQITPRVIHADMLARHILVDEEQQKLSGIIDFSDVCIGDPAYDFCTFGLFGDSFLTEVYKSYDLEKDNTFEIRRKFYQDILPLRELMWAITFNQQEMVASLKTDLSNYIKN